MPLPEPQPSSPQEEAASQAPQPREPGSADTDLIQLVAAAADLCRKPLRHGVVLLSAPVSERSAPLELNLRLEARSPEGARLPQQDLELEIYPSGRDLNLTLAWCGDDSRPMLWQGSHPVWMDSAGSRCGAPADGAPLEALARRLRALLVNG